MLILCLNFDHFDPFFQMTRKARSLKSTTTQPAVGGPKTFWEDQRAWRPKNLAAQRAERTKVLRKQTTGRTKNYLTNRWDTEKLNISLKTETKTGIVYFDT